MCKYENQIFLTRFALTFGTLRFDKNSFFQTFLKFESYRDYKPTNAIHADSPVVYTSDKNSNLYTRNKIHSKCDVIDGSVVNVLRQPILFSFILNKLIEFKVFCEPETIYYKKINKSVLNTITFF